MAIKSFIKQILCGILFLTLSTSGWSMDDAPPPVVPASSTIGDVPAVSIALPDASAAALASAPSGIIDTTSSIPVSLPLTNTPLETPPLTNTQMMAQPSNYQIESGNLTISTPNDHTFQIDQSTDTATINMEKLSFNPHESFIVHHLNNKGTTLIRVNGENGLSQIWNMTADGKVILSNPAGVTFGKGGVIDVHGILATTAYISTKDFNEGVSSGSYVFTKGNMNGTIHNQGTIKISEGGFAALIGNTVIDEGVIPARLGTVILAGAEAYVLNFGDRLINFEITSRGENSLPGTPPSVTHSGSLISEHGTVLITTKAARQFVLEDTITMKNIPQAISAEQQEGVIILKGEISADGPEKGGHIRIETGKDLLLDHATLSAKGEGQEGGSIKVLGPNITTDTSTLTATGKQGGGKVFMGGGYQGKNPDMENSESITVDTNTVIDVSAITTGDGGEGIIWSDGTTRFEGTLLSKGGAESGNGGDLEISGKEDLIYRPKEVDTFSPKGNLGHLLLDPQNLEIKILGGIAYAAGGNNRYQDFAALPITIDPTSFGTAHITLQANTDLTITDGFTLGNNKNLILNAGRSIIINDTIRTQGIGTMTLLANDSGNAIAIDRTAGEGNIEIATGKSLTTAGGALNMTIGPEIPGFTAGKIITDAGGNVNFDTSGGVLTVTGNIQTLGAAGGPSVVFNSGNANLTITGDIAIETPLNIFSDFGDIVLTGTITGSTGNENVQILSAHGSTKVGNISHTGTLRLQGPNSIFTTGTSIANTISTQFDNLVIIEHDTTFSSRGDITNHFGFDSANPPPNGQALTLDTPGSMILTGGTIGLTPLKSLTLRNAINVIGDGAPIQIDVGILSLGTKNGGYFQGTVASPQLTTGYAGVPYHINGVLFPAANNPTSVIASTVSTVTDTAVTGSTRHAVVETQTTTQADIENRTAGLIRAGGVAATGVGVGAAPAAGVDSLSSALVGGGALDPTLLQTLMSDNNNEVLLTPQTSDSNASPSLDTTGYSESLLKDDRMP